MLQDIPITEQFWNIIKLGQGHRVFPTQKSKKKSMTWNMGWNCILRESLKCNHSEMMKYIQHPQYGVCKVTPLEICMKWCTIFRINWTYVAEEITNFLLHCSRLNLQWWFQHCIMRIAYKQLPSQQF